MNLEYRLLAGKLISTSFDPSVLLGCARTLFMLRDASARVRFVARSSPIISRLDQAQWFNIKYESDAACLALALNPSLPVLPDSILGNAKSCKIQISRDVQHQLGSEEILQDLDTTILELRKSHGVWALPCWMSQNFARTKMAVHGGGHGSSKLGNH